MSIIQNAEATLLRILRVRRPDLIWEAGSLDATRTSSRPKADADRG
jgi:hypothetical protein